MEQFYERFLAKVGRRAAGSSGTRCTRWPRAGSGPGTRPWTSAWSTPWAGCERAIASAKWTLGLDRDDRVGLRSYGKQMSLFERMLLKSLRENTRIAAGAADLAAAWSGVLPGATLPLPTLLAVLREDGTLARVALMDGRPVAMAPYWIRVE